MQLLFKVLIASVLVAVSHSNLMTRDEVLKILRDHRENKTHKEMSEVLKKIGNVLNPNDFSTKSTETPKKSDEVSTTKQVTESPPETSTTLYSSTDDLKDENLETTTIKKAEPIFNEQPEESKSPIMTEDGKVEENGQNSEKKI